MYLRLITAFILGIALSVSSAQDTNAPQGPRGQRGGTGGGMGNFMGRGITGSVTEVAADHFAIKTQTGETYTVHYSANTRFMKQMPGAPGDVNGQGMRGQRNQDSGRSLSF